MSLKVTNARRKQRVRNSLRRSANGRPRLSVFRSSKHIYAQVIDDLKGETLASASSLEKTMREAGNTGANIDAAKAVGKLLAERAVQKGVKEVVFDRGQYLYHGRVKALADAAPKDWKTPWQVNANAADANGAGIARSATANSSTSSSTSIAWRRSSRAASASVSQRWS